MLTSQFIGKPVEVGDFFWGNGMTLHSNNQMKRHLGFENGKAKNRKRRCFYILQIISETLVLTCTTTIRNSHGWKDMPEEYYRYFLPVDQTPEVRGRRAITVNNDWDGAFKHGKSLLFLENIEVMHSKSMCSYICSAAPRDVQRIQWETRAFALQIWWGKHLSPKMSPGCRRGTPGQLTWQEDRDFVRLSLDSKGLIILPEANTGRIRHSSNVRIERYYTQEAPLALGDTTTDPAAENGEFPLIIHTTTHKISVSGPPKTMMMQRPSQVNVLTPRTQAAAGLSTPPPSPGSDSGYDSNIASQRSGSHSMSRQTPRRLNSPWHRSDPNPVASPSIDKYGFQEVKKTRKPWRRV
ncbi:hypothetical protein RUND412_005594 [Rhizina undulata]